MMGLCFCRAHEWCKHGTCSGMPDEHTFFKTILDYYDNNMFGNILQNQGIVPSDDTGYDVSCAIIYNLFLLLLDNCLINLVSR